VKTVSANVVGHSLAGLTIRAKMVSGWRLLKRKFWIK